MADKIHSFYLREYNNLESFIDNPISDICLKIPICPIHVHRAFHGCFAIIPRKWLNYDKFMKWKDNPNPEITEEIAKIMVVFISNNYDFITTAPPSKNRDWNNYCCFKLCEKISEKKGIPFRPVFKQRHKKMTHGRFASMKAELPQFIESEWFTNKTILFIDDMITSRTTAIECYKALIGRKCHVDGLIFSYW